MLSLRVPALSLPGVSGPAGAGPLGVRLGFHPGADTADAGVIAAAHHQRRRV